MKVLQICHKMPNPPSDGGAQAIHNTTLGFLKSGIDLKVLSMNPTRNQIDIGSLSEDYLKRTKFEAVVVDTKVKPLQILFNFFKKESYFIERFKSNAFELKLKSLLSDNEYDVIQLEHLYLFLYVDLIRSHSKAKIVYRPQNVEYVIWERFLEKVQNPLKRYFLKIATKRLKKFEMENSSKADGIITLTPDDLKIIGSFTPNKPSLDIPMGFVFDDLNEFDASEQFENFPIFYHLGSMDWMPNEEAIDWFVNEISDLAIQKMPDIKIHLAGRNMQDRFFKKQHSNLIVEGEITDAINYQKDKAIMIVPLLSGSGIRAKIVEGIALGKTIITTTIGAQGINYIEGENLLIADTPQEFVEQMYRCYSSKELCMKIGVNAQELAKEEYHYVSNAKRIVSFYNTLLTADEK